MLSKEIIEKVMFHDGEIVIVSRFLEAAFEELQFRLKKLPPTEGTVVMEVNNDPYSYSRNWGGGFPKLNRKQLLAIIEWIAREQKEEQRRLLLEEDNASFSEDLAIYFVPRDKIGCKYPCHHDSATQYRDSLIPIYKMGWKKAHSEDTFALKWGVRSAEVDRIIELRKKELTEKYTTIFNKKVYELFYPAGEGYWLSTNDNDFLLYTEDDVTRIAQEDLGSFEDFVEFNSMEPWQKKLKTLL